MYIVQYEKFTNQESNETNNYENEYLSVTNVNNNFKIN